MTHRLGTRVWATGIAVLAAAAACGSNTAGPGPTTAAPTSPSVSQSASPSSGAATNATALIRHYFQTLDAVRSDPSSAIGQLNGVMTSIELSAERHLVMNQRSRGLRQVGRTRIDALKVTSVNLDDSSPAAGRVPTVSIAVCWDISQATLVDKTGHSVATPGRADRGWTAYSVANYQWRSDPTSGWRVADSQDLKQAPCAAP